MSYIIRYNDGDDVYYAGNGQRSSDKNRAKRYSKFEAMADDVDRILLALAEVSASGGAKVEIIAVTA